MNMLHVVEGRREHGVGRRLVSEWEHRCRQSGHAVVMTFTSPASRGEPLEIILKRDLAEFST